MLASNDAGVESAKLGMVNRSGNAAVVCGDDDGDGTDDDASCVNDNLPCSSTPTAAPAVRPALIQPRRVVGAGGPALAATAAGGGGGGELKLRFESQASRRAFTATCSLIISSCCLRIMVICSIIIFSRRVLAADGDDGVELPAAVTLTAGLAGNFVSDILVT